MSEEKDKILIVEDDIDTLTVFKRMLEKNGFEVETAKNGMEALEKLKNFRAKVIVADWMMPVMDGLKLLEIIRQDEKYKGVFFIILTARTTMEDKVAGLDIGADDYLTKPAHTRELIARIKAGIRIYNLQNEVKGIEQNKAVVKLACTIGHQINNPLASLIMSLQNIESELKKLGASEDLLEDFEVVNESVERIRKFANFLEEIDKPEFIKYASENEMLKFK